MLSLGKIWKPFADQLRTMGADPEPLKRASVGIFGMAEYTPILGLQLEETLLTNAEQSGEFWSFFVGYDKQEDLERIAIPQVMSNLRDFLVDDQIDSLFQASAALMQFTARELIRRGKLPVLYEASLAAAEPAEPLQFRVVGAARSSSKVA